MRYPAGTIIKLTEPINDRFTPKPVGSRFEIDSIDDQLQLHGRWLPPEKGNMAVSIEEDHFEIVKNNIKTVWDTSVIHVYSESYKWIDFVILLQSKNEIGDSIKLVDQAMKIIDEACYQWLNSDNKEEKILFISLANRISNELHKANIKHTIYDKTEM